jgi:hypothetical protein
VTRVCENRKRQIANAKEEMKNSRNQTPMKQRISSEETERWNLEREVSLGFGVWNLELHP